MWLGAYFSSLQIFAAGNAARDPGGIFKTYPAYELSDDEEESIIGDIRKQSLNVQAGQQHTLHVLSFWPCWSLWTLEV